MSTAPERARDRGTLATLLDRYGLERVHAAVAGAVLFGLAARLYDLGGRVAHWDEGRVAYWILDYTRTGNYEYDAIIHGPFYHHVNGALFGLLGPSDFSIRLAVALLGGLFPLVALLFRGRLRDLDVAALAALFAVTPTLLYYTRFMRGDPIVAMGMFTAFACLVRAVDTGRTRYVHAAAVAVALAFTAKENALVYLITWVGATVLLLDHRLLATAFRAEGGPEGGDSAREPQAVVGTHVRRALGTVRRYWKTLALAAVEFLVVIVYFYAPRAGSRDGPGLRKAFRDPGTFVEMFPTVVEAATVGAWQELWGTWVSGGHRGHAYLPYLGSFSKSLAYGAAGLCLLAIVGFLADRYSDEGPSDLVSFAFYWGFVSVLGYPIITDITAPWATLHAVVPLAIPAAVGARVVVDWGLRAAASDRTLRAVVAGLVLLAAVGQLAAFGVVGVYADDQAHGNELVQYAQPADDFSPVMDRLAAVASDHDGADIVLYGDFLVAGKGGTAPREPACAKWFNALPIPWYLAAADAETECAVNGTDLRETVASERPPVVVGRPANESDLRAALDGYVVRTYRLRVYESETRFFVREDLADGLPGSWEPVGAG